MKVSAFLGSPRKNGNTSYLLNEFLKGVSENKNNSVDSIFLQEYKISECMDCNRCKNSAGCVQNDDMQKLYPVIKQADVLVIAAPVYWWSMPGHLKTFIDRFYAFDDGELKGKKAYLLLTYGGALPNSGPVLVEKTFKEIFDYIGIDLVKTYGACTDEYIQVKDNDKALKDVYEMGKNI